MITRRRVLLGVLALFLVGVGVIAWTLAGLPPVKYYLRYGLDPYCEPTGEKVTLEGVEFVEIGPGIFRMGSTYLAEGGDWLGRLCAPLRLPWGSTPVPGASDVEIRVARLVSFRVEVTNWRKEQRGYAFLSLPDGEGKGGGQWIACDGVAVIEKIRPGGRGWLFIRVNGSDLIAYRTDVDARSGGMEVALIPGERITGRLHLPQAATKGEVVISGSGVSATGTVAADGTFEIPGVPRGTWPMWATWQGEDGRTGGRWSGEVTTGTYVDVTSSSRGDEGTGPCGRPGRRCDASG